jgi:hypothetical protein
VILFAAFREGTSAGFTAKDGLQEERGNLLFGGTTGFIK